MKAFKKLAALVLFCTLLIGTLGMTTFVSAEDGGNLLTNEDFFFTGMTVSLDDSKSYVEGENSIKASINKAEASICFKTAAVQELETYSYALVNLRIFMTGGGYTTFGLYKTGGEKIDYGFPKGKWNNVTYKALVLEQDGVKYVYLGIKAASGVTMYLSNLSVTEAPEEPETLFNGPVLYQMEPSSQLMESYVITTSNESLIVIDGGDSVDATALVKHIRTFKNEVDHWFISHYHSDHVNALIRVLNGFDIKIKNLYFDFPTVEEIKKYSGDADNVCVTNLEAALENHPEKVENIITPGKGYTVEVDDVTVKVLNDAYKGASNNYGNDTSLVFKVETPGEDILFLNDLGARGDVYMDEEDGYFLKEALTCSVVQLGHHGQRGTTDYFYSKISHNMKVALYAAKQWIYDNDGGSGFNSANLDTLHMRDLVREWGVMNIYTQANGRVRLA